ncbi:MAG TPA: arylsulfatase [Sedimentisphaerales bacterium]|nr:arylsulfatase [Sedimentisphaerales bacterium]
MRQQTRREFLKTMGVAAASAGALSVLPSCGGTGRTAGAKRERPNVVLVMTDDQGYGDLGCHGNKIIKTPNLDRLYTQSVRLTDFHVAPSCSPTRAGLMTGRYCNRTGVWHTVMGRNLLRKDEVTVADVFKAGGYRTGIFGKWHLGDNYPFRPGDRGFDEVLIHHGGGIGNVHDYWGNDYIDDTYCHNGKLEKFTGYCTDIWFAGAMGFIEKNKDQPFFCYLPTNCPHGPHIVPEKYSRPYEDKGVNAKFYGMIANIDENMGRLMKKLKELGIEDNTVLIFMTDNGGTAGVKVFNAGMRGQKGTEYDGGHRVPCFIRWPGGGLGGGVDVVRLTAHLDLLPTLIELCGLTRPPRVSFDGASLVPLLMGHDKNWPDRTIITDSQRVDYPIKWRKSAVMTDRWRLINGKELYDIKADPGQEKDVADKHREVAEKLRQAYEEWWADVSKRFDEYCEIIIGSDKENPSKITSHDWHSDKPWNQTMILWGEKRNSFWAVEVARDGEYEFSLRRWPEEVNAPIRGAITGGEAIDAATARLRIADFDRTTAVAEDAAAVTFKAKLKAGKTRMETWFYDKNGQELCGAYYVYVNRL